MEIARLLFELILAGTTFAFKRMLARLWRARTESVPATSATHS